MEQITIDYRNNSITIIDGENTTFQMGIDEKILNLITDKVRENEHLKNVMLELKNYVIDYKLLEIIEKDVKDE